MITQFTILTPKVTICNGKATTTSQAVATYFGKLHKHVIAKIESLDCSREFASANFSAHVENIRAGAVNRDSKYYQMTKDGFVFLVMGFTGKKAAAFKEAYITEFNRMEAELSSVPKYHPQSPELLSHDDLSNLTRLVWCMSNGFHFNQSWSNAIWYALRQVTGIPSPQRFEVQKIPLLAEECRRIYMITNQFKNVIFEAEKQVIRRCLRKRENAERVISEMQQSLEGAAQSNVSTLNSTLAQWEEREINLFAQRSHNRVAHHSSY
ncbi:phage regulatory protein, rha family [Candidatus Regiella insecticola 5.15]|uniref:Phage regulatory protein, rha family n=1 Tax=Candidatus Regiella insecticola 5.15 TaxID=1005043 RepID=G2H109_9ENTR|nr:Rha family transcriptional regulator [Candidatus Regiella insecticola]EGY28323.1 phage regulatory protein, rha family [Candidatus Regiella insecticola 5.15]